MGDGEAITWELFSEFITELLIVSVQKYDFCVSILYTSWAGSIYLSSLAMWELRQKGHLSLGVQGQSRQHSKTLSLKRKKSCIAASLSPFISSNILWVS